MSGKISRQVFNLDYVCPVLGTKLHLYETIILHEIIYRFGSDSACGKFIVGMRPSHPRLALVCRLPLSTFKKYLAILLKRKLLETNAKTEKGNNIYYSNLLTMKPFLMTDEQIEDYLINQKKHKMESEERRLNKKKESHKAVQVNAYNTFYDQSGQFRGHGVAPENLQKENFQGPQEKLLGATGETFRGHGVAPTNYETNTEINKLNTEQELGSIPEQENIYLFSCDNNIYEEEEVVEDKPSSQPSVSSETYSEAIQSKCISNYQPNNIASMLATVVSQDANIIVQPSLPVVVEDCDRPEKINSPSEVSASDKLLAEIQQMRARGDIHPDIASSKTDEILVMEAGAHIAEQTLKTSKKTGLNFTYEQGLGSFKAMVKSGAFTTPNSMDAFIQHKLNKDKHKQAQSQKEKDDRLKFLHDHIFRKLHTALLESSQPVRDVNATSFKAAIRANYFIEHEAKEHVDLEKVIEMGVKYALKNPHVGQLLNL